MRSIIAYIIACAAIGYGITYAGLKGIERQQAYAERQQLIRCQQGYQRDCKIIVARQEARGR